MDTNKVSAFKFFSGAQQQNQASGAAQVSDPKDLVSLTGAQNSQPESSGDINTLKAALFANQKQGLSKVWETSAGNSYYQVFKPVVRNDGIYVNAEKETKKINLDGTEAWHNYTGSSNFEEAAFDDNGNIYVTGRDKLTSIDPAGKKRWDGPIGKKGSFITPLVTPSAVYTADDSQKVTCFDLNGEKQWSVDVKGYWFQPPLVDDSGKLHLVYCPSHDVATHIVIDDTKMTPGEDPKPDIREAGVWGGKTQPLITKDGSEYGFRDGKFRAINADGTEKWAVELTGQPTFASQNMGPDGNLYVLADKSTLFKLSPDGTEQWRIAKDPKTERLSPNTAWGPDGTLYITGDASNPCLYAINPDGSEKWARRDPNVIFFEPVVAPDGTVFTGGNGYQISARSPVNGREMFTIPNTDEADIRSFGLCPGGDVIAGWSDGHFSRHHFTTRQEIIEKTQAECEKTKDKPALTIIEGPDAVKIGDMTLAKKKRKL